MCSYKKLKSFNRLLCVVAVKRIKRIKLKMCAVSKVLREDHSLFLSLVLSLSRSLSLSLYI